jgi:hypothetical protein
MEPEGTISDRGYVYLVDSGLVLYKIGLALDPWLRLRDMQVGSPVKLELLAYAECRAEARMGYEGALHGVLGRYWKHGEWFEMRPRLLRWCMATFANIGAHAMLTDRSHGRDYNKAHADWMEALVARLLGCEEIVGTDFVIQSGPCEDHAAMAQRALRHPTFPAWRGRFRATPDQIREWLTEGLGKELAATVTSCIRLASVRLNLPEYPPVAIDPEARQRGDLPLSRAARRLRAQAWTRELDARAGRAPATPSPSDPLTRSGPSSHSEPI